MKKKNLLVYGVLGVAAYLVYKACCLPQVTQRLVYQPIRSPEVYDHLYQDARMTEVLAK